MPTSIHFDTVEHSDHIEAVRTDVPFDVSGDDLYERCLPMLEVLERFRHVGLLVDLRSVAQGTGPNFQVQIARVRREAMKGHPRIAYLVETPAGRLQVSQQLREDEAGSHIRVFSDEEPARQFARGVLDTSPLGS